MSRYAIDAQTGALAWRDDCALGENPNWVEAISLG
jgi:hypothetical protein